MQTLYTYPDNFRAYKALIAAQYSGAKVTVAADFVFGQTNKSESFLKKFPTGKVSLFSCVSDAHSDILCRHFACANIQCVCVCLCGCVIVRLRGTCKKSRRAVRQYLKVMSVMMTSTILSAGPLLFLCR